MYKPLNPVNNFSDNSKDEFVARVRAHAQKIMGVKGTVSHRNDDVTPFEQFLTLGRLESTWKLKEIVAVETRQELLKQENLDQDSIPLQLNWYHQHKCVI